MPKQIAIRLSDPVMADLEALSKDRGMTLSAVIREAIRALLDANRQLDEMAGLEKRLVGSMTRVMKDVRLARNDLHLAMAFVNTLAEVYLLHTPPLPDEAVDSAAASATDRHRKFIRRVIAQLQGGEGLWSELLRKQETTDGEPVGNEFTGTF